MLCHPDIYGLLSLNLTDVRILANPLCRSIYHSTGAF